MFCPFLKEAEVESCRRSVVRKMIMRTAAPSDAERCVSAAHLECELYKQDPVPAAASGRCPYLENSLVQYCSAASVTKYIPHSEVLLCRCGTDSHRYCDLYLAMAHPEYATHSQADGLLAPRDLYYAPNHMWLDVGSDGMCHIGIDALLAAVIGTVERITYVTGNGVQRPAAVLRVNGTDLSMVFPNPLQLTASHVYLRANPDNLTADPYRLGWLFEGRANPLVPGSDEILTAGLLRGDDAASWMSAEAERISQFVHECASSPNIAGEALVADGGTFGPDLLQHLDRDQMLNLWNRFFSPYASWTR